ncbi:MAG: proprotein convertase P-domain-containing protein [Saprospiraceae bacterium]
MKRTTPSTLLFWSFLLLFTSSLRAQTTDARIAPTQTPLEEVDLLVLPRQDNEALLQEELKNRQPGIPPKFAMSFPFDISPFKDGTWEDLPNGQSVWRFRILSPNAHSLNLGFGQFFLPKGSQLILYSPDQRKILGPFTPADNESHQELWTPILEGDEMVVELRIPKTAKEQLQLKINTINHDFLGFSTFLSGSCNLDVICGAADGWGIVDAYRDIIQSVGVYSTGGSTFCTGFLVNTTRQDCSPFFMTADHCGIRANNAASMVVYWNFQNSTCRTPNSQSSGISGNGTLNDFNTGAVLRARSSNSDFTLLELDDPVSETANAFFAGWDASDKLPSDTVIAIHHPSTDEKRISFSYEQVFKGNENGQALANGNYLVVPQWSVGTTEGGSSGCPFFDKHKRVIGQLFGGLASCNNSQFDAFGWFAKSWEGGGSTISRLKDWLDPDDTGLKVLDGRTQNACNFTLVTEENNFELCATNSLRFGLSPSANFADSVQLSASDLPTGVTASFSVNPVAPGSQSFITLNNLNQFGEGAFSFSINGTDGTETGQRLIQVSLSEALPTQATLTAPLDQAINQSSVPGFSWTAIDNATAYEWQLSLDPAFAQLAASVSDLTAPQHSGQSLATETSYYWRVRGLNSCGEGEWSEVFSFTTSGVYCLSHNATDVPVAITASNPNTVRSKLAVAQIGQIASVVIHMNIKHSYISDLSANLISPSGTAISLFVYPGENTSPQGCANDDLVLTFSDGATSSNNLLTNLCGNNSPAISGQFKPRQAFSAFSGEEANGIWTLEVVDGYDEDGGQITDWSLDICTTFPQSASLIPSINVISICPDETFNLDLIVGAGFSGNSLQLSNGTLPAGASITFEQNPVSQASSVAVSGSGFGEPGQYAVDFSISDGNITANTMIMLEVNSLPNMITPVKPVDQAALVGIAPTLYWSTNPVADSYKLILSTASDLSNPIFNLNTTNTSINVGELNTEQTYYWQVAASNECGSTLGSIWSFTTIPDVSFVANPNQLSACPTDEPGFSLLVDPDFLGPVKLSYAIAPSSNLTLSSEADLNALTPGQAVSVQVKDLTGELQGDYVIQLTLSDGTLSYSSNLKLRLDLFPQTPILVLPLDGTVSANPPSLLGWSEVAGIDNYLVEIATDAAFENIIESAELNTLSYQPGAIAQGGTYFWRVSASNVCGDATAAAFQFTYTPNAIDEVEGATLAIFPNPTTDELSIQLSRPIASSLQLELHSINGQRLLQLPWPSGQALHQLHLAQLPAGVYILSIRSQQEQIIKRIIKQ